ncbi:MAG: hypothetical protein ACREBS_08580 [Nitrososphaerales archaeon]
MSLRFGVASPPRIHNPELLLTGIVLGLVVLILSTFVVDKLGTAMFKRGFAKPFYIKGHRIHHSCIYFLVPAAYAIFVGLFLLGFIQINWRLLWNNIAYTTLLLAGTLLLDFVGDKYWPKIRKNVILHHEWLYTLVPAYILTYVVVVVV